MDLPTELPPDFWADAEAAATALPSQLHVVVPEGAEEQETRVLQDLLVRVGLPSLFLGLHLSSEEGASGRSALLSRLLLRIFGSTLGRNMLREPGLPAALCQGLGHQAASVRRTTADVVKNMLQGRAGPEVAAMVASTELQSAVAGRLVDEDVGVGAAAGEALASCALQLDSDEARDAFFRSMLAVESSDSMLAFRAADAVARCAGLSDANFAAAQGAGALLPLLDILSSDDVLLKLNAHESLLHLVPCRAAVAHLFQSGCIRALLDEAQGDDPIAGPAALRVVSTMLAEAGKADQPSLFAGVDENLVSDFLSAVVDTMDQADEGTRLAAMWAVSSFASASPKSLDAVRRHPGLLESWLRIGSLKVALKGACLLSLARAIRPPVPPASAEVVLEAFAAQNSREASTVEAALAVLLEALRSPVEELRLGVFAVLAALGSNGHRGAAAVYKTAGVREMLLNRSSEASKACLEGKFAVIEALSGNGARGGALTPGEMEEIHRELQRGPYYKPSQLSEMETL